MPVARQNRPVAVSMDAEWVNCPECGVTAAFLATRSITREEHARTSHGGAGEDGDGPVLDDDGRRVEVATPRKGKRITLVYYKAEESEWAPTNKARSMTHEETVVFLVLLRQAYENRLFDGAGSK